MKIFVLNGSPKRERSDTMRITRAFLDGMNEAEPQAAHTIHRYLFQNLKHSLVSKTEKM